MQAIARQTQHAGQVTLTIRWYRISEVLKRYLKGRQLDAPLRLAPARTARGGCGRQHIRGTTHRQLPDLG